MKAATLFSGIGAPECAMAHWDWRFCAEIEKVPAAVHAVRFPRCVNLGDVTAFDFSERAKAHAPIDVLVFGSPCQSFSTAGKRLGLDDPRGNLALVALEIARQLRPRWLVFENVPGLLSSNDRRDFGIFLSVMEQCGHLGAWRVLDAQFGGVPQRRRRLFFVGYLGDWRPPAAVLFEPESLRGDSPPRRQAREGIAGTLSERSQGGGVLGTDFECGVGLIARCDTAGEGQRQDYETTTLIAFQHNVSGANFTHANNIIPTMKGGSNSPAIAFNLRGRDGGSMPETDDLASLRAADGGSSRASQTVRRLTPVECERLMGFPDGHTAITYRGKPLADGPRYRALGNSMVVPEIRWILERVEHCDALIMDRRSRHEMDERRYRAGVRDAGERVELHADR